jgi:hypothetical protein
MPNTPESLRTGRATRCAVCDGKFGLVRHYSWRTALCSRKCVDRFRTRRQSDSGGVAPNRVRPVAREPRDGLTTIKISQLSTEHLVTARTLVRAAEIMIDSVIAGRLRALAEDSDRRYEKTSRL